MAVAAHDDRAQSESVAEMLSAIPVPTLVIVGALDMHDFQAIARRLAGGMRRHQFNQLVLAHLAACTAWQCGY
jgi:hypothetical protein